MTCGPVCRGRGWWVPLGLGWSTKKREATWPHAAPDSFCGPYPDEGSCRSVVLVRLFAQNLRISSLGLVLGKLREVHQYDTCSQTLDRGTLHVSLGSRRRVDNDQTSAEDFCCSLGELFFEGCTLLILRVLVQSLAQRLLCCGVLPGTKIISYISIDNSRSVGLQGRLRWPLLRVGIILQLLFKLVGKRVERRIEKEDRGGMREMEGENKYENIKIKREEVEEKEARGGTREMEGADKNEERGKQRVLSQKQE